jgi:chromosomal replication initiator protein
MGEWDYSLFWNETLKEVRGELGEQEFSMWFTNLEYLRAGENEITIAVPSLFFQGEFCSRYQALVERKIRELTGKTLAIRVEAVPRQKREEAPRPEVPAGAGTEPGRGPRTPENPEAAPPTKKKERHPQIREDYTFDRYVIGENNRAPANAAMAIARNPGKAYNPFFLYGGAGLGKTHLIQAIGNYIHHNGDGKIIYITAEDFLNEFVGAIRGSNTAENKMPAFKNKFRRVDVLLIDDVQFLQEKPGAQEELFYTIETLYNAKKQMVFTCDRPASELKKTAERLISRFKMGFNIDIYPPNYETRCAILKSKIEERGLGIPEEVVALISKNVSANIRELEGALTKLTGYAELVGAPITVDLAQKVLKDDFADRGQGNISVELIQKVVTDYFSLNKNDLILKKRPKNIVMARQIAMYISRKITDYSTIELGQSFGGRDHATVIYSCEKIDKMILADPNLDATIQKIERMIKEYSAKS